MINEFDLNKCILLKVTMIIRHNRTFERVKELESFYPELITDDDGNAYLPSLEKDNYKVVQYFRRQGKDLIEREITVNFDCNSLSENDLKYLCNLNKAKEQFQSQLDKLWSVIGTETIEYKNILGYVGKKKQFRFYIKDVEYCYFRKVNNIRADNFAASRIFKRMFINIKNLSENEIIGSKKKQGDYDLYDNCQTVRLSFEIPRYQVLIFSEPHSTVEKYSRIINYLQKYLILMQENQHAEILAYFNMEEKTYPEIIPEYLENMKQQYMNLLTEGQQKQMEALFDLIKFKKFKLPKVFAKRPAFIDAKNNCSRYFIWLGYSYYLLKPEYWNLFYKKSLKGLIKIGDTKKMKVVRNFQMLFIELLLKRTASSFQKKVLHL